MTEEKRQVLAMLAAGKITPEQAARLLEALGEEFPELAGDCSAIEDMAKAATQVAKAQAKAEKARAKAEKAGEALEAKRQWTQGRDQEEAESELEDAEAELEDAEAELEDAEAELEDAEAELEDTEAQCRERETGPFEPARDWAGERPVPPPPAAGPLLPLPLEENAYEAPASGPVSRLKIDWINGPVEVRCWEGEAIRVTEYASRPLKDRERMALREEGGQLTISWSQSPALLGGLGKLFLKKHLVVELPQNAWLDQVKVEVPIGGAYLSGFQAGEVKAETVSGPLSCRGLGAEKLKGESVSGTVRVESVAARVLDVESVSGMVELLDISGEKITAETVSGALAARGSGEEIKLETVSGTLSLEAGQYPRTARMETVSGSVRLGLPQEGPGFTLEYESRSGNLNSRFPLTGNLGKHHGRGSFGAGGAEIHLETVSGAMELYPL